MRPMAALPALAPGMLVGRSPRAPLPFPFGHADTRWFYLGRGAVFHAVQALGLAGTEVLVPAYHHGVEIEALEAAGAKPVFYGVRRDFSCDLADLESRIGAATRAIYVIHVAGRAQPLTELVALARGRGLKLIEDCALSLFSVERGVPLGRRGDASVFCLHKSLPVPHGGALWMPTGEGPGRLEEPAPLAVVHQLASSFLTRVARSDPRGARLSRAIRDGAAALRQVAMLPADAAPVGTRRFVRGEERRGLSPVVLRIAEALDWETIVNRRRSNHYALHVRLRDVAPPVVDELAPGACPLFYPLWCDDKPAMREALAKAGIEAIDFWRSGSSRVRPGEFPEVEALRRHVLELPIHQDLDHRDMARLANEVRRAVGLRTRDAA